MKQGLYIHIPFCDRICRYCDFAKVYSDVYDHLEYVKTLVLEYKMHLDKRSFMFDTVYFGGGTPSALNVEALEYLLKSFATEIASATEITFEANPESLTEDKVQLLVKYGVNRVSLGVQTFDEKQLKFLNRLHVVADIERSFTLLRKYGIENINLDLIYALPKQNLDQLTYDLEQVIRLKPTHISTYALIIEPHTSLYLKVKAKKLVEVADETQEDMYHLLQKTLTNAGYQQYEFSNWAFAGKESKHNSKYWQLTEYLGIGLGSHGFYNNIRYGNTRSIVNYVKMVQDKQMPTVEVHNVSTKELMEEMLFLGLRLIKGVEIEHFNQYFSRDFFAIYDNVVTKHINQGNLIYEHGYLRLSEDALFLSNDILSGFLLDEEMDNIEN